MLDCAVPAIMGLRAVNSSRRLVWIEVAGAHRVHPWPEMVVLVGFPLL